MADRSRARRVLLTTEGTYPFVVGGVSTWCDLLVNGLADIDWQLLAVTAGDRRMEPRFPLPANVSWAGEVRLWGPDGPARLRGRRRRPTGPGLPARLAELLSWSPRFDDVVDALVSCRLAPGSVDGEFGSRVNWDRFLHRLRDLGDEREAGTAPAPEIDLHQAVVLYRTLYWIARTAATPTPEVDLCHVTAAGWAGIPAVVHAELHGTPVLLTEHGVYVREAYLAAIRTDPAPARRFLDTRLARNLAGLAYRSADLVVPVTGAHDPWERHLTDGAARIVPVPNGVTASEEPAALPGRRRIVSVGRLDPLKDVATLLRVAAVVCRRDPDAEFLHYGPVPVEQQAYGQACVELHEELGLGDRFRFMGATSDPRGVMRDADIVILTSISEGFPMAVLEASAEARPVVATAVGGVAEALEGCGLVVPPGRVHDLADAVLTLLDHPDLAADLGRRGRERVARRYDLDGVLRTYDGLFEQLLRTPSAVTAPSVPTLVTGAVAA